MRVLWFTHTPSQGSDYIRSKRIGGGWIQSLEAELTKNVNIELGVAFKCNQADLLPFKIGNTQYFPYFIKADKRKLFQIYKRWNHDIESNYYNQHYLDIIQQFNPDIIQIFGTEFDYSLIASLTSIPCVIHIQGNLITVKHKWFSGLTAIDILRYANKKALLQGYGIFHQYFIVEKSAERELNVFKSCKYYMGRTEWDKRLTTVLSPNSKYFHCEEIIRQSFYSEQWKPNNKNELILFVSIRNVIYKGLEVIFECSKLITESFPNFKFLWKVAGIAEGDELVRIIEKKYKGKFKSISIQLLGSLGEKELIDSMLTADVFVHPSHIDNSPNSLCEAMILGMPIISTSVGGIPNLIENRKEGILIQDGDPFALAGGILELFKDKDLAQSLGANARKRAFYRHNPEKIGVTVYDIYSSILNGN